MFVGSCATGLLVTEVDAAAVRATQDVDVIAEVLTLTDYYALEHETSVADWHTGEPHDFVPET